MLNENAQIRRIEIGRSEKIAEASGISIEAMRQGVIDTYSVENGAHGMVFILSSRNWTKLSEEAAQRVAAALRL